MWRWLLCGCVFLSLVSQLRADEPSAAQAAKDRAVVETLLRLKGMDVNASPAWKAAALRHLETLQGTPKYVDLVEKLRLKGVEDELFRLAITEPGSTSGAKAAAILVKEGETDRFLQAARSDDESLAVNAIAALGDVSDASIVERLKPVVVDNQRSAAVRVAAVNAVGKNRNGQQFLLNLAAQSELPPELTFSTANILLGSADEKIRSQAGKYLSLPASANSQPLPPITELVKLKGDAGRGKQVFQTTGTCVKCHQVRGEGKQVGPDLSQIGSKLSRDAFYVSILDPNAGISHNYESYVVVTAAGNVLTGLLVNKTDQSVTIRTAEGLDKEIASSDIEEFQKSKTSLMPADLQKLLTIEDLVDVVEFLTTLK